MMQGDQYRIPISLTYLNGEAITKGDLKDLEVMVGSLRKTLSDGGVSYDESEGLFYVYVMQKETFMLYGDVKLQARLLFLSGDVRGIDLGTVNFQRSASKVVLK